MIVFFFATQGLGGDNNATPRPLTRNAPSADSDSDSERPCTGPPGREEEDEDEGEDSEAVVVEDEVGEETEDPPDGEEGAEVEELARPATLFVSDFFCRCLLLVVDAVAGASGGMDSEPAPAGLGRFPLLFFFFVFLVVVGPAAEPLDAVDAVLLLLPRTRSAAAPLNESAAIPSAIASSDDVRRVPAMSRSATPLPLPPAAGVGVASIRGTST